MDGLGSHDGSNGPAVWFLSEASALYLNVYWRHVYELEWVETFSDYRGRC